MPIIGTPLVQPPTVPARDTPSPVSCEQQNQITPAVSRYYDKLVLQRLRSIRVRQGQHAKIQWRILDPNGFPVDLTACGFPEASAASLSSSSYSSSTTGAAVGFRVRIRENLSVGQTPESVAAEIPVSLLDAAKGHVEITLDKQHTAWPGVYFVEIGVFDYFDDPELEVMLFSNVFYLLIERGQFGARTCNGPPTLAEIRLHLRDSGGEESLLLDNIKFDDAEIALAISRPIEYWNEIPPPLCRRMTTRNFPYRYHWLEAICANLFWMVAENFRANNLQYSAAGVQVNDQDKEQNYEQAAARRDANWKDFVRRKKGQLNLEAGYGGLGSSYNRYRW